VVETRLRVAMICTGNICRSPMAEVVLQHYVDADSSLRGYVDVTSAGTPTGTWAVRWTNGARRLNRAGFNGAGSLAPTPIART